MIKFPLWLYTTNARLRRVADTLELWGSTDISLFNVGICANLLREDKKAHDYLSSSGHLVAAFESWDKYSGRVLYPVPHDTLSPNAAFLGEPHWTGEYGDTRRELCLHLAQYIRENVL